MASDLTREAFETWLREYGRAWEKGDPEAAAALFTDDALYFWTPFQQPKRGRQEIAAAWRRATSTQADIRFTAEVWAVIGNRGVARWRTSFRRRATGHQVELDGILSAEMDATGRCAVFREWWHSTNHGR